MFELHPKTRKLLALLKDADYGTEFSYAQILQQTGCDLLEGDRHRLNTVWKRLERDHRRTLVNQRGRGYKVANPNEHVDSMRVRSGRARNHLVRAKRTAEATPLERLTEIEARELTDQMLFNSQVIQAFQHQNAWNYRQAERIDRLERRLGIEEQRPIDATSEDEDGQVA